MNGAEIAANADCFMENGGQFMENGGQFMENGGQFMENGGQFMENGGQFMENGGPFMENGGEFMENGGEFMENGGEFMENGGEFMVNGGQFMENRGRKHGRRLSVPPFLVLDGLTPSRLFRRHEPGSTQRGAGRAAAGRPVFGCQPSIRLHKESSALMDGRARRRERGREIPLVAPLSSTVSRCQVLVGK